MEPDNGGGGNPEPSEPAAAQNEPERAAAMCEHCGTCHVVRVRANGTLRVIGTNGTCECGESDYRVLGAPRRRRDATADDDAPAGELSEM